MVQLRSFVLLRKNKKLQSKDGYEAIKEPSEKEMLQKEGTVQVLSDIPRIYEAIQFTKRFFVLHSEKISLMLAYSATLVSVSLVDNILVVITIAGLLLPGALNSIGTISILFCQLVTILSYVCQFTGFTALMQEYIFNNNEELMIEWLNWLGVSESGNLFAQTLLYNLLILSLIIERNAKRWADETLLLSENNEKCMLFEVTKKEMETARRKFQLDGDRPLLTHENFNFLSRFALYYISNCYRYHGLYVS